MSLLPRRLLLLLPLLAFGCSIPATAQPVAAARPAAPRPGGGNEPPGAWSGVGNITDWQVFTARADDGRETPALWVAPPGPGPFPAVVWFHGAPANQGARGERNESDRGRFDLFLEAGFVVCLGDYRSEPAPAPAVSGVDDAVAIIRHVKSLPMVDPQRVAVMGHSLGGATTLLAALREPVACVVDSAAAAYAILDMPMGSLRGKPAGGELPESDYNRDHALALLKDLNAPTLILYGRDDPLSRINKTIHDLLKGLNKDVRLEIFPDEHHGMLFRPRDRDRGLRAWTTMVDFVSGVLKPTAATRTPPARPSPAPATAPVIPEGTRAFRDLAYVSNGHPRQKLDLYIPTDATRPTPVIVWIHGGGWASGDKSGCPPLTRGYTQRGYAAASLNYRLSGHAIFPAQIEDCKAALRWLRAHAKEYNLDPDRIAVWGGSAGGHLVALLAATGATREFDVGEHLDQSSAVQAAVDYFGPTDVLQMDAHALPGARLIHDSPGSPESRLVGGPIQDPEFRPLAERVNPIRYLTKAAPPHLIVHGDQDPLVPHHQSEILFAALKHLGVPARFHTIVGAGHGTGFGGADVAEMVAAFLDHHLLGRQTEAAHWPAAMTSTSPAVGLPAAGAAGSPPAAAPGAPNTNRDGRSRPTWAQFVERHDANGDGRVLATEFKGPPGLFQRLDRNGDGAVTREEFEPAGSPR